MRARPNRWLEKGPLGTWNGLADCRRPVSQQHSHALASKCAATQRYAQPLRHDGESLDGGLVGSPSSSACLSGITSM